MNKFQSVLITQNDLYTLNGSVVITLELAKYLKSCGVAVTIYTYFLRDPVKEIFQKEDINITEDENTLALEDFDLIWVHHQVLPLSIIEDLAIPGRKKPVYVFNHMSSLDTIADEFPYVWDLENKTSSLSLFNSKETLEAQSQMLDSAIPKQLYQNPAPEEYITTTPSIKKALSRILVVSNHPPKEILELDGAMKPRGIKVDYLGDASTKSVLITPAILINYDAVISIGKTVQNCLVGGIPVYVYDHFGGPGYLNTLNFKLAEEKNFSGRGFEQKTTTDIVDELITQYDDAYKFIVANKKNHAAKYLISSLVNSIFENLQPRKIEQMTEVYIKYLKYSHIYSREHRIAARYRVVLEKELAAVTKKCEHVEEELKGVLNSKAYRLGDKLAKPVRYIKNYKSMS